MFPTSFSNKFFQQVFYLPVLFLGLMVLIISCESGDLDLESEIALANNSLSNSLSKSTSILSYPSVVNNTLEFNDPDHFFQFFESVNNLYDSDDYLFDSLIANIYVDSSEISPLQNFTSIYKDVIFQEFASLEAFNKPAIGDPVMWALLNEHYEFIAGDWLYVVLSDDLIARIPKASSSKNALRAAIKGKNMSDYTDLPADVLIGSDTDFALFPGSFEPANPDGGTIDTGVVTLRGLCAAEVKVKFLDCNTIEIYGFAGDLFGGEGTADFDICTTTQEMEEHEMRQRLNNGTCYNSTNITASTVEGSFSFIISSSSVSNYISVLVDSRCSGSDGFVSFNADNSTCDFGERRTWSPMFTDTDPPIFGTQGVHGYVYYNENWFGSHTGAKAYGKWWNGSKWRKHKKKLIVKIDEWRNYLSCGQVGVNKVKTDDCKKCYSEKVRYTKSKFSAGGAYKGENGHCDTDTKGTFTKKRGGTTITGSQYNDYDCCP
ncbi:MAG: hypothetical protein GVX96_05325 [Bacteroidetes bacterium]|jgi:hypothetical protein|nr:hypothetical protein [Bacteroidota bacterium]